MNTNFTVILISGKMGAGKSTLANSLFHHFKHNGHSLYRARFADILYEMHNEVMKIANKYEITDQQTDKNLLQLLGTEWGRNYLGSDVWVNALRNKLSYLRREGHALFTVEDARFKNEFFAFEDAIKIRLSCDRDVRKARCDNWREREDHPSETDLDEFVQKGMFHMVFDTAKTPTQKICEEVYDYYLKRKGLQ